MRVVSREELRQLPPGTLFTYYEPAVCEGLYQLGTNTNGDFYIRSLLPQVDVSHTSSDEFKPELDASWCREGLFDDKQQYAVWEPHDLAFLGHKLWLSIRETSRATGSETDVKWLLDQSMVRLLDPEQSDFPEVTQPCPVP